LWFQGLQGVGGTIRAASNGARSERVRSALEVTVATGYCVKCKASREIKDAKAITMKNGRPATQGICPVCGTKIFKIGAS
jgi:hypothetical protein